MRNPQSVCAMEYFCAQPEPVALPIVRSDHEPGTYWCIAEGCEGEIGVLVTCSECGARFACKDPYHRDLLYQVERKHKHLRRNVTTYELSFGHRGWPFRRPTGGRS